MPPRTNRHTLRRRLEKLGWRYQGFANRALGQSVYDSRNKGRPRTYLIFDLTRRRFTRTKEGAWRGDVTIRVTVDLEGNIVAAQELWPLAGLWRAAS